MASEFNLRDRMTSEQRVGSSSSHLTTIANLREKRTGEKSPSAKRSGDSSREETNDGQESDYSDLSDADYADADLNSNAGYGEGDSDVDEDESNYALQDPQCKDTFLLQSLFVNRPSTVWFEYAKFAGTVRQQGRELIYKMKEEEKEKEKSLLFRSNHTIICLGGALKRSGFRRLLKGSTYNVFWGHHLKEPQLQKLHPNQVVNHFPGSYTLGRKDYLWKNISKQARSHPKDYDFCAKTYVLPRDRELLQKDYEEVRIMPFFTGLARFFYAVFSARGSLVSVLGYACALPQPPTPLSIDLSPLTRALSSSLCSLSSSRRAKCSSSNRPPPPRAAASASPTASRTSRGPASRPSASSTLQTRT